MEQHDGYLWVARGPRCIPIQRVTPIDVYRALRAFGVGESQAVAVASGLITIRIGAK